MVHCTKGCDRTGMIIALAMDAAGVDRARIVADHRETERRLQAAGVALGVPDDTAAIHGVVASFGTTLEQARVDFLDAQVPTIPSSLRRSLAWIR